MLLSRVAFVTKTWRPPFGAFALTGWGWVEVRTRFCGDTGGMVVRRVPVLG